MKINQTFSSKKRKLASVAVTGAFAAILLLQPVLLERVLPFLAPHKSSSGESSSRSNAHGSDERVEWRKVWSDEFHGSRLDTSKWNITNTANVHNNELQYYTPDEVWVQDSKLTLRSRKRNYSGADGTREFTSGKVTTQNKFSFRYGTIEMRAKLPASRGIWPAFWLLPVDGSWPPEIDVFELLGHNPNQIHMSHHWGTYPNQQSDQQTFTGPNFASDYHRFTLEWQPGWLRWKVDGVTRKEVTHNVPDREMYLILNTAVGGDWPGSPDRTTHFPQYFHIDYIQVFQRFTK